MKRGAAALEVVILLPLLVLILQVHFRCLAEATVALGKVSGSRTEYEGGKRWVVP